jgi:hypothetical protein
MDSTCRSLPKSFPRSVGRIPILLQRLATEINPLRLPSIALRGRQNHTTSAFKQLSEDLNPLSAKANLPLTWRPRPRLLLERSAPELLLLLVRERLPEVVHLLSGDGTLRRTQELLEIDDGVLLLGHMASFG